MPIVHQFGGSWTDKKLEFVRDYLKAYQTALKNMTFPKSYIDAFAGTGFRKSGSADEIDGLAYDEEAQEFQKGSASVALEVEPAFDRYLFIDKKPDHIHELERLKTLYPYRTQTIEIVHGEANQELLRWCRTKAPNERAVVFLDPYGMQVEWSVMEALAKTKMADVWVLVPIGQAINRVLTRAQMPPDAWSDKLTRFFGTDDWKNVFYKPSQQLNMFGDELFDKQAGFDNIATYFIERLKTIFAGVAPNYYFLYNSQNVPLYMLCFASANPRGSEIAVRIANHLLRKK